MINIPIYRAKRTDNGEYIEGYYTERVHHYPSGRNYINFHNGLVATYERIDPSTLAIHFPDMLDSKGNKIFASLSEDGKGGDILKTRGNEAPCKFNKGFTIETIMGISNLYMLLDKVKVIGIQE